MRLIDIDALIEKHCEGCSEDIRNGCKTDPVCATLMWFEEAPTVDAVPMDFHERCLQIEIKKRIELEKRLETEVVHGRWIKMPIKSIDDPHLSACSVCGCSVSTMWEESNYCPKCGAKMRR